MRISDCSSDVCSSDLLPLRAGAVVGPVRGLWSRWLPARRFRSRRGSAARRRVLAARQRATAGETELSLRTVGALLPLYLVQVGGEIGRASCRDRVCQYV